jgi:hypothetical protein
VKLSKNKITISRLRAAKEIPSNWLDPLLSGPTKVISNPPYTCRDIEQLLNAIRARLLAAPPEVRK